MIKYSAEICPPGRRCMAVASNFDTLEQAIEWMIDFSKFGGCGEMAYIRHYEPRGSEIVASEVVASVNLSDRCWIVCLP